MSKHIESVMVTISPGFHLIRWRHCGKLKKKKKYLAEPVGRFTVSCHASFDVQFAVNPGWKLRASINATLDYRIPWTGLTDLNEKRKQLFDEILCNVFTREGYSGPGPKRLCRSITNKPNLPQMNSHGNEINFRYYHCEVWYHTIPESELGIYINIYIQ